MSKDIGYGEILASHHEKTFIFVEQYIIMAKRVTDIPVAPVYRIMREAGANRVKEEAKLEMVNLLVEILKRVSDRAADLARHAGRNTIFESDIKQAFSELRGR